MLNNVPVWDKKLEKSRGVTLIDVAVAVTRGKWRQCVSSAPHAVYKRHEQDHAEKFSQRY